MSLNRRELFNKSGIVALGGIVGFPIGLSAERQSEKIEQGIVDRSLYGEVLRDKIDTRYIVQTLTLPHLPPEADGMALVMWTDMHADRQDRTRNGPSEIRYTVSRLNEVLQRIGARPDSTLIMNGGDVLNHKSGKYDETLLEDFEPIPSIMNDVQAAGVVAVEGNHEGVSHNRDEIRRIQEGAGHITLGHDRLCVSFLGVPIIGLPDHVTDTFREEGWYQDEDNLSCVQELVSTESPKVILTHSPSALDPHVVPYDISHAVCFAGHLHGLHAPDVSVATRMIRQQALRNLQENGYKGKLSYSSVDPKKKVLRNLCDGFGNHPKYNGPLTPRFSAYSILITQFRAGDHMSVAPSPLQYA